MGRFSFPHAPRDKISMEGKKRRASRQRQIFQKLHSILVAVSRSPIHFLRDSIDAISFPHVEYPKCDRKNYPEEH